MASRRQRSRKHARAVQHQAAQRERLRSALASAPTGSMRVIGEHMGERGFEPDGLGGWSATPPPSDYRHDRKRGPVVRAILTRRKAKSKRKGS